MIIQETTKMSEREKMAARNSNFCYLLNALYPVGSIYVSKDPTDPAELFGGSWKRIKERFIWAIGDNENPGDTGGEKTHTLSVDEMPSHAHSPSDFDVNGNWVPATDAMSRTRYNSDSAGTKYIPSGDSLSDWKWGKTSSVGGSQPHNNMPPWEGFYIWERIESDVPMGGSAGMLLADQTYNPESANAQSGIAVAQAIDTCSPAIITASDTGKAISIPDSSESVIRGLTAYGESVQDGTPTPDSPVEIVSIENPTINVYGKNLFDCENAPKFSGSNDISSRTKNTITLSGGRTGATYISCNFALDIPIGTKLTLSGEWTASGSNQGGVRVCYFDPGTNRVYSATGSSNGLMNTSGGSKSFVITAPNSANDTLILLLYMNTEGSFVSGDTITYKNVMVNIGETASNYQPYIEPQTLTIPYTFRGLKNTSGDWVARDELRVGDGKVEIVRNVGIVELKGTETFRKLVRGEDYVLFYTAISNYQRYYGLCNYYKVVASGATAGQTSLSDRLYFGENRFTEVTDFKSWLSTQYSAGNPVVYYYGFETAAVEDITATEAGQALLALKTNYPNTSVISDIDLNLTYRADTKNYIDNKIAALTALTLEG